MESGSNIKQAKFYQNVVHQPLIVADDGTLILQIFNVPELHLLIGKIILDCKITSIYIP